MVEAMSMGLPAIVTNWSGVTAFLSSATGYPLPYELVPSPVADGHYWAEPSASALRGLMRRVVERPHEAKAIGAAARAHVATHYSQQAVAEQLVYRLQQLEPTLKKRREKHLADRAAVEAKRAKQAKAEAARARRRAREFDPHAFAPHGYESGRRWPDSMSFEIPSYGSAGDSYGDDEGAQPYSYPPGRDPVAGYDPGVRLGYGKYASDLLPPRAAIGAAEEEAAEKVVAEEEVGGAATDARAEAALEKSALAEHADKFHLAGDQPMAPSVEASMHNRSLSKPERSPASVSKASHFSRWLPAGVRAVEVPLECPTHPDADCCLGFLARILLARLPRPPEWQQIEAVLAARVVYAFVRARPPRHLSRTHLDLGVELKLRVSIGRGAAETEVPTRFAHAVETRSPRWWLLPLPNVSATQVRLCRKHGSPLVLDQLELTLVIA